MHKKATTFDDQILKLRSRGVEINDEEKAREILADIGYYRLGFYFFPFEKTYPELGNKRCHDVVKGTTMEFAVALYYYDFDLRNILSKYLSRVEIAIRTTMIYELSNKYSADPVWFINPNVVEADFINDFDAKVYDTISKKPVIKRHSKKHPNDKYAPAWKTMEFMMFGSLTKLYDKLKSVDDKLLISRHFGVNKTSVFFSYIEAIRHLRNACAHGHVLYDINMERSVTKGPAGKFDSNTSSNLVAALSVLRYILSRVSINRQKEMDALLDNATLTLYSKCPTLRNIIESKSGIKV